MNFEIGDVVSLKSGSHYMTIESIDGNEVTCTWFDESKNEIGVFKEETLVKQEMVTQSRSVFTQR